jgi:hypothetical protein
VSDEFDDLDPLRRLRPDRVLPDHPGDPAVFAREKERLMAMIDETGTHEIAVEQTPGIYPRLAYDDEYAALDYLVRVFGMTEIRESRMESEAGHYARAVAEGAEITMPLEDAFYGYRRYEATDLEGHRWHFSESLAAIRGRGGEVAGD